MRTSLHMLRWLSAGIFALIFLLALVFPAVAADTGTYRISNYVTTLEPQSSGQVKITYEQQWEVLSGNIPWITVGLPNSSFSIQGYSGAATGVSAQNSGGFTGVRVDLDRSYSAGQTFNIQFSVLQSNLLERLTSENKWRINFTPGWYDRATTDHLQITLISPVSLDSYTLSPPPSSTASNTVNWVQNNIAPGGKFNIIAESTDGSFLSPESSGSQSSGVFSWTFFIIIGIILIIGFLIFWAIRSYKKSQDEQLKRRIATYEEEMAKDPKRKKEIEEGFEEYVEKKGIQPDAEGRYYDNSYGNYITPAIWAAIILSQQMNRSGTALPPNTNRPSCACACVSCACACACACAGGGAAGCARKTLHECRECSSTKLSDVGETLATVSTITTNQVNYTVDGDKRTDGSDQHSS